MFGGLIGRRRPRGGCDASVNHPIGGSRYGPHAPPATRMTSVGSLALEVEVATTNCFKYDLAPFNNVLWRPKFLPFCAVRIEVPVFR
jgi:hypothetical protein